MQNKLHKKMLTSSDLKKFFNEDLSFEQDGKRIYLVPLKEFMKSEEFSKLPSVTYIDKDNRKTECHFLNSITLSSGYVATSGGMIGIYNPKSIKKFGIDELETCVYIDESGKVEGRYPVSVYNGDFDSFLSMLDGEDEDY